MGKAPVNLKPPASLVADIVHQNNRANEYLRIFGLLTKNSEDRPLKELLEPFHRDGDQNLSIKGSSRTQVL
jgi:hypothetical protein